MSLDSLLVRNVTIQTATPTVDRYNNTTADWATPVEVTVQAWVSQTQTVEDLEHRDATADVLAATFGPTVTITSTDRVVVDGRTYEVDGKPHAAWTPRGLHHIEVNLRAVNG